jgi:hypothetical protein
MAQHKDEDKANPPQLDTHVPPSQQSAQGPVPKPGEPVAPVPNPMAPPPAQAIPIPEEAQPKEDDKSKSKK